jgi:hypothetical protein
MASLTAAALGALTQALVAACPGVTGTDGSTIWYSTGTTCQAAAQGALAAFNPATTTVPATISSPAFIVRLTPAEQAAVWKAAGLDTTGVIASGILTFQVAGSTDLNSAATKAWMAAVVAAGAITQARANIIMTPPAAVLSPVGAGP